MYLICIVSIVSFFFICNVHVSLSISDRKKIRTTSRNPDSLLCLLAVTMYRILPLSLVFLFAMSGCLGNVFNPPVMKNGAFHMNIPNDRQDPAWNSGTSNPPLEVNGIFPSLSVSFFCLSEFFCFSVSFFYQWVFCLSVNVLLFICEGLLFV